MGLSLETVPCGKKHISEPLRMEIKAKICRMLPCMLPIPFRRPCLWSFVFEKLTKMHHLRLHIYICIWMHVWIQKYQVRPNIDRPATESKFAEFTI